MKTSCIRPSACRPCWSLVTTEPGRGFRRGSGTGPSASCTTQSGKQGTYVPTRMGERYDALLWLEHTNALRPVHHEGPTSGSRVGNGADRLLGRGDEEPPGAANRLNMGKAIVVGINGSARSDAAPACALQRAARDKLPVIPVHAVDDRSMSPDFQYHEIIRESGMELLKPSAGECQCPGSRRRSGDPAPAWQRRLGAAGGLQGGGTGGCRRA